MENLISKSLLHDVRSEFTKKYSKEQLEYEIKQQTDDADSYEVTLFLSHKHNETRYLASAIAFFKSFEVMVYVDWLDETLPNNPSGVTAKKIKERIELNNKFVLLATEGAIKSKWCNWELGYGDSLKYPDHMAIMPVTIRNDKIYSGSEYLSIYPVITADEEIETKNYFVEFESDKTPLTEWLKR